MEIIMLNSKKHGLFFSIYKFWQGAYVYIPWRNETLTIRIYLFCIDYWWSYDTMRICLKHRINKKWINCYQST